MRTIVPGSSRGGPLSGPPATTPAVNQNVPRFWTMVILFSYSLHAYRRTLGLTAPPSGGFKGGSPRSTVALRHFMGRGRGVTKVSPTGAAAAKSKRSLIRSFKFKLSWVTWVMISMAGVWQGGSATKFELIVCRFSCPFQRRNNKMDRLTMNDDCAHGQIFILLWGTTLQRGARATVQQQQWLLPLLACL